MGEIAKYVVALGSKSDGPISKTHKVGEIAKYIVAQDFKLDGAK